MLIIGKIWECINPSEGQALMRRKSGGTFVKGSNSRQSGICLGLTSRHNRSMVGHRVNGDAGSKPAKSFLFYRIRLSKTRLDLFFAYETTAIVADENLTIFWRN